MRGAIISVAVLLCVGMVLPLQAGIADAETQFRQRASSAGSETGAADITEEVRFGREVAARVIGRYGLYENPQLMKYVNLVGRGLAMSTNRPEIEFRFAILNTDEINAYAAPGGYVFLTRGALAKMQDEAELAGVLAHELAHIVEKHVVKELQIKGSEKSATTGLALLIGGTSESARIALSQAVDKAVDMLFKDGYKREDEVQADKDAVVFCALAGYDPSGLVKYFERINAVKGKTVEVLDKTHPPFDARIALLKNVMSQEGIEPASLKNQKERFADSMKNLK